MSSLLRPWKRTSLACMGLLLTLLNATAQPNATLLSLTNSPWRYDDAAIDRGTAWRATSYPSESTWRTGRGLFGLEGSLPYPYPEPIVTPLIVSSTRSAYYFRTHFNFTGSTVGLNLIARAYIDDGAVIYLNGTEAARVRMPDGAIAFGTRATTVAPEGVVTNISLPTTNLLQGDNVLAVEVHQRSASDADVVFGLSLETLSSQLPVFTTPGEPADRAVDQDAATTLFSPATGFPSPTFQWFKNNALLPGATSDSLVIPFMTTADAGSYFCVAANSAGSITSRTAIVTYVPDTNGVRLLYALGLDEYQTRVVFSEPPEPNSTLDNFAWLVYPEGSDLGIVDEFYPSSISGSGTEYLITSQLPRDPATVYLVERTVDLEEAVNHGNILRAGAKVPIAAFDAPLILMDDIHQWKYNQSGADLGNNWRESNYNDSGWLTGLAPFDGYRQASGPSCRDYVSAISPPVRTCITLSNAANTAQIPTVYFRTKFNFAGDATRSLLRLQTAVNDGAVYYLNGVELIRSGMPSGEITYDSLSTRSLGDAISETFIIYAPSLVSGENTLAVELHQGTLRSESMTLGIDLYGILPTKPVIRSNMIIRYLGSDTLEVIWSPAGGVLECTDDPSTGWAPVQEIYGADRLITSRSAARKFYRVLMP